MDKLVSLVTLTASVCVVAAVVYKQYERLQRKRSQRQCCSTIPFQSNSKLQAQMLHSLSSLIALPSAVVNLIDKYTEHFPLGQALARYTVPPEYKGMSPDITVIPGGLLLQLPNNGIYLVSHPRERQLETATLQLPPPTFRSVETEHNNLLHAECFSEIFRGEGLQVHNVMKRLFVNIYQNSVCLSVWYAPTALVEHPTYFLLPWTTSGEASGSFAQFHQCKFSAPQVFLHKRSVGSNKETWCSQLWWLGSKDCRVGSCNGALWTEAVWGRNEDVFYLLESYCHISDKGALSTGIWLLAYDSRRKSFDLDSSNDRKRCWPLLWSRDVSVPGMHSERPSLVWDEDRGYLVIGCTTRTQPQNLDCSDVSATVLYCDPNNDGHVLQSVTIPLSMTDNHNQGTTVRYHPESGHVWVYCRKSCQVMVFS